MTPQKLKKSANLIFISVPTTIIHHHDKRKAIIFLPLQLPRMLQDEGRWTTLE